MRPVLFASVCAAALIAACAESPTTPAVTTESSGSGSFPPSTSTSPAPGDRVVWQDNFDQYASSSDLFGRYSRDGRIEITDGRGGSGRAVRFVYGSSIANSVEKRIAEEPDLYVRYWYRTSPGADPSNAGTNTWGMEMLRAIRGDGSRWQVSVLRSALRFSANDNSARNFPASLVQNVTDTPRFGTTNDGQWHEVVARLVSGDTGSVRIWVDGTLILDSRGLGASHTRSGITLLRLPGSIAAAPRASFTVDMDDLAIWVPAAAGEAPPVDSVPPTDSTPPVDSAPPAPSPAPVARLTVSPDSLAMNAGTEATVVASAYDSAGTLLTGRSVTWTSSNTAVATVSAGGLVRAVAAGSARITATSEGRSASAAVAVTSPVAAVATVTTALGSATLATGQTTQATAVARDASGNILTGRTVAWSSSNTAAAIVSAAGLVTAVAPGSANIVATVEGRSGSATVTVAQPAIASVAVTPASVALQVQQTAQLSAVARDAAGNLLTGRAVTWATSNPAIASVSPAGTVTGVAGGTATITATSEGRSGSATVSVAAPAPVPAPSGSPSPTGTIILRESFDRYGTAADLRSGSILRSGNVSIVPGRAGNGVRFAYTTATPSNEIEYWFNGWDSPTEVRDLYVSYSYRLSPGADPTCGNQNPDGFKWFMAWRPSGHARYTMGVSNIQSNTPGAGPQAGLEFTSHDNSSSRQPSPFLQNVSKTPRFGTTNDGQWHTYTVHIRTGPEGFEQIWVDGVRVLDNQGMGYDHDPTGIVFIRLPGNMVRMASGCDFTVDIDDLNIWTP